MNGHFLEFGAADIHKLAPLAQDYSRREYLERVTSGLLVRPAYIHRYHFEKETLERVFESYRSLAATVEGLSPDVKIALYHHRFFDPAGQRDRSWPWGCGLQCEFRGRPFMFPFFSSSGLVMKLALTPDEKRQHLRSTFSPILSVINVSMRFRVGVNSLTHEILMELGTRDLFEFELRRRDEMNLDVLYRYALSAEDMALFKEPSFLALQNKVRSMWDLPPGTPTTATTETTIPSWAKLGVADR